MSSTLSAIYVHVVFATEGRQPYLRPEILEEVHRYLGGSIKALGAKPLIVGGVEDHVHMLLRLHPSTALSNVVRDLKKGSTHWLRRFPGLSAFAWQNGYAAFSVSQEAVSSVTRYIARQEEHHAAVDSETELAALLEAHGLEPYSPPSA